MKYIIETNITGDTFGAFVPGRDCRNVGIEEMKGYYYWPGDVWYVFMQLAEHMFPTALTFNNNKKLITASFTDNDGNSLSFRCISEEEAAASGKQKFIHDKWIEQLRADKKAGKNWLTYNR